MRLGFSPARERGPPMTMENVPPEEVGVFVLFCHWPGAAGALPPSISISWESPRAEPEPGQVEVAACRNPEGRSVC